MRILYITYDGLTDFIGQSQVLPYLLGCAAAGHRLTLISFEKPGRKALIGEVVERQCREAGIRWLPQKFRTSPPYVAKLIDQRGMHRVAMAAAARQRFDLLHCRSYQAAVTGLAVKRRTGTPLLFDMRGFLPDSRREGGRWRDATLLGRMLFRRWKSHEAQLIAEADHIVSLTDAARREIERWPSYRGAPISTIPCCADFSHFKPASDSERERARERLGIAPDAPVLGYLGSRGTIYMISEHLGLFNAVRRRDSRAKALFIGNSDPSDIFAAAAKWGIELGKDEIRVIQAERADVPFFLGALDAGTCFYTPTWSSLQVSPTKLAEYLACGVPVIANRQVGDVEAIVRSLDAGHVVQGFGHGQLEGAADAFFALHSVDRTALRKRARPSLDLPSAVSAYLEIYGNPTAAVRSAAW